LSISTADHRSRTRAPGTLADQRPRGQGSKSTAGTAAACAAAAAGAGALAYLLPGLAGAWAPLRAPLAIEDRVSDPRGYALTFDDGPHPRGTPAMLEELARRGSRATFFVVGEQVRRCPGLVGEIIAAGHRVGVHCDRHRNLLRLGPRQVADDLARVQQAIEGDGVGELELYRPPYGVANLAALWLARRRRWRTVLWSHWGRDWEARATPESIAALLTAGAGAGSVLLLHDADEYGAPGSWRRTLAALPRVLDTMERRGLHPVLL